MPATARLLPDGRRLHLHHGPIDCIVEAYGERDKAYAAVAERFATILDELVAELPRLRLPVSEPIRFAGETARAMQAACRPFAPAFITPMAAVAGAVADTLLGAMVASAELHKAYVNDGGDIAVHLAPGATIDVAVAAPVAGGRIRLEHADVWRGIATSGWRGRSHSLGIADSVTVVAGTAAEADAAATMIGNAVDLPAHPHISRQPAQSLWPDSDLGDRLVTTEVGDLSDDEIAAALDAGEAYASDTLRRGLIGGAVLMLRGAQRVVGAPNALSRGSAP